jgi:hypothetical protein
MALVNARAWRREEPRSAIAPCGIARAVRGLRSLAGMRGKLLLCALVLPRVFTLFVGCGPKDGDEGGHCIKSKSCNKDDYCNGDLVCRSDTCVREPGPPPSPEPPCDVLLNQFHCPSGLDSRCLEKSATPDPAWNGVCSIGTTDQEGDTLFCCDMSRPTCYSGQGSLVPRDGGAANKAWYGCPGEEYACHELSAPPISTPPIQCGDYPENDAGWATACCVSGDTCFTLADPVWGSPPDPRSACTPGEWEYFCTGTATLDDPRCRAVALQEGPEQAPAFCCVTDGGRPTVRVGPAADAGADGGGD